jgi:hypothetical protein
MRGDPGEFTLRFEQTGVESDGAFTKERARMNGVSHIAAGSQLAEGGSQIGSPRYRDRIPMKRAEAFQDRT